MANAAVFYEQYTKLVETQSEVEAMEVLTLLELPTDVHGGYLKKAAKFIRCNTFADVYAAATETAQRIHLSRGGEYKPVQYPWAYCVHATNAQWARTVDLHLRLSLYEYALRYRISGLLDQYLGANWWRTPTLYMRSFRSAMMLKNQEVAKPGPGDQPEVRPFSDSGSFLEVIHLGDLHEIVHFLWLPIFQYLINPPGHPAWNRKDVEKAMGDLAGIRNRVAHARPRYITSSVRSTALQKLERLMVGMEFDTNKAVESIRQLTPT
jgi:hypothetical protein